VIEVHKRALAEQDLIDVWRYSYERWGAAHADAYLDQFDVALERRGASRKAAPTAATSGRDIGASKSVRITSITSTPRG